MDHIIQSLWIGKIGLLERLSIASFMAHGHRVELYTYEDVGALPDGAVRKDAREILPESAIFRYTHGKERGGISAFADLFRYKLLALKGGWWCDMDVICLKPLVFTEPLVLASERARFGRIKVCVGVMRAPAGHALMQRCFERADAIERGRVRFAQMGEPVVRAVVDQLGLREAVRPPEDFNPICWWRAADIVKPGSQALLQGMRYTLHCYGEGWRWRTKDRECGSLRQRLWPADTLLGALQRRYLPEEVLLAAA